MSSRAARTGALAAIVGLTLVGAACGRIRGGGAPRPQADAPRSASDSARRDSARLAAADTARRDTTRRDTARAPADTAARDTVPVRRAPRRDVDPSQRCGVVNFNDSPPTSRFQALSDGAGNYINFIGGGVVARCEATGSVLKADSAEYYQTLGQLILVFNVSYDEPRRAHLTSQRLTYFTKEERLLAEQNVYVTLPSGTSMTGPSVEYLRAVQRVRPASRMTATGRPTVRVIGGAARAAGSAARSGPDTSTTIILANTIVDEADSVVYASGAVQINRSDVAASADSATFDQVSELARLLRNATIRGVRDRPFTMTGARIDLFARERELSRVAARDSAQIVSEDLNLRSDTVDLRLRDGKVERAIAWGPSRAVATSPERDVVADSIDAVLPGQRVRELRAVRHAVARSATDTTKIVSKERDELRGDTIHARFDTLALSGDTTKSPPVRRIEALGNASSLYQIANQKGRTLPPSINYVRGRNITVDFDSGQVQTVTVTDSAFGVYLQPADSAADSAGTRARPVGGLPTSPRPAPAAPAAAPAVPRPAAPSPGGAPPSRPPRDEPLALAAPFLRPAPSEPTDVQR